jgi:hypothetical protein
MTTCAQCLARLATESVATVSSDSQLAVHTAVCPDCARTLEDLRYAERYLGNGMASMTTSRDYVAAATGPLDPSERLHRKRIARRIRFALFALAGGVVVAGLELTRSTTPSPHPDSIRMETIPLGCLTPRQASELVTPYLRSNGSAVYTQDELRTVTIRGRLEEFNAAKAEIARFDALCKLPVAPSSTTPADGK